MSDKEQALTPNQFEKVARDIKKLKMFLDELK